ncbi:DNA internalization-related competence protein ComEC/Rec2 [Gemmatimonas sp.]|uniref:DNA internalization-related competence protein ComEC/Rec2 n=1 Tax=Gemmatimonas sp. TaxID=1962908 RepID=UPI003F721740
MAHTGCGMPLLIHAAAWWLAGLYGAAWPSTPVPWLLLLVAAVVLIAARRLEPVFALAGLIVATSHATEVARCTIMLHAALQRGQPVWVTFDEVTAARGRRAAAGRGVAGELASRERCAVPVSLQWRTGTDTSALHVLPVAGDRVQIRAVSLRTARGLRLTEGATHGVAVSRDPWRAWRARLGDTIDAVFRTRAPLVRALLIADQQGIAPDVRDRYADAGLVHLLSVSGMHVAIIASALLTLGGVVRAPRRWVEPLAMLLVAAYVLLLGCPAPAVRSAVMLMVVSVSAQFQRPVHEWTALALGAVMPTANAAVVHDLGWQLSVSGMAALVAARALKRQWRLEARREPSGLSPPDPRVMALWRWLLQRQGVGGWLVSELLTGLIATAVTAPVIAWTFGRISVVAPLSNIAAGPVVAVLQPALFLALLWALVVPPTAATMLPDATQPLMRLLDIVADVAAAVPGAVVPVAPMWYVAVGMGVAAALVVRGTASRYGRRWYLSAAAVGTLTVWLPLVHGGTGELELHLLDVGQGDAIALRTPKGRWILVDAGPRWTGGDAGRRTVIPYIRRHGGAVALFVLSHPHDDHAGGAASVIRALRVPRWWEPAFVTASPGYADALQAVRETRSQWERVRPGTVFRLDGVTLTVLAPDSTWTAAQHDANETSVVLRVQFGRHRMLLTGDAERNEEQWLLQHYPAEALRADVLKVGHHGSRTSSSPAFLAAVAPRVAVASLGAGNRYGHPAPETLLAFLGRGIPMLRTDHEGAVVIRSNGVRLQVLTEEDRWTLPPEPGVR